MFLLMSAQGPQQWGVAAVGKAIKWNVIAYHIYILKIYSR